MKKHDYLYNRRGYGAHIKLDPLVGKSPASAGVPPQTNKATVINSQSLLKGSGYYPKKVTPEINGSTEASIVAPPPPVTQAPKITTTDEIITIHVCDERKKIDKDFKCKKSLLLTEMKYFEKHLKATDSADDIDISVHCDIKIFEWLMNYLNSICPKLEVSTVIPILISADFLIMERLIDDCIMFLIVKIPIDMGCLSQQIVKKISKSLTLEELDACKDPRDSLQSKLFVHKLEEILKEDKNKLLRCIYCNTLFTAEQNEWMSCPKAEIFIDYRGRVLAKHVSDSNWDINEFFSYLRKQGVSWRRIFWKVWARLITDECAVCKNIYVLADVANCSYHPDAPVFMFGCNSGTFPCCNAEAIRFSTSLKEKGCTSKRHTLSLISEDSLEYKFLDKHFDILKENLSSSATPKVDQGPEVKLDTQTEDNSKEASTKHKSMSLLACLNEFISNKTNKLKQGTCPDCAKMGKCCNKCLLEQDEDDNEEEDREPQYLKEYNSNSLNIVKKPPEAPSEEQQSNENLVVKYKIWKNDFRRVQDRVSMNEFTKKLKKLRQKSKEGVSSTPSKPFAKSNTGTVSRVSHRKFSKK